MAAECTPGIRDSLKLRVPTGWQNVDGRSLGIEVPQNVLSTAADVIGLFFGNAAIQGGEAPIWVASAIPPPIATGSLQCGDRRFGPDSDVEVALLSAMLRLQEPRRSSSADQNVFAQVEK